MFILARIFHASFGDVWSMQAVWLMSWACWLVVCYCTWIFAQNNIIVPRNKPHISVTDIIPEVPIAVCSVNRTFHTQIPRVGRMRFLGSLTKLCKATIRFVMAVRPQGTTVLPLDGFLWNLIFDYFSKMYRENEVSLKSYKNNGYFTWRRMHIYVIPLVSP